MEELVEDNLELKNRKLSLKVQAYQQRVAQMEDNINDLRVELTLALEKVQQLEAAQAPESGEDNS